MRLSVRKGFAIAAGIGLASLLSGALRAEGAVKLLECEVARVCDAGGVCNAGSGAVSFVMEPDDLEDGGAGSYTISYRDTEAAMRAITDAGPFLWTIGRERHALIPSSETEWLWHALDLEARPTATIRFLVCSFQQ